MPFLSRPEVLQSMTSANPVCQRCVTSSCGIHIPEMERVFKSIGKAKFKGSGFYETDYKNKDKKCIETGGKPG